MTTDTPMVELCARPVKERSTTAGREPGSHLRSQPLPDAVCIDLVVAVLECLRTPTPEMVEAATHAIYGQTCERVSASEATYVIVKVIDRALHPSKGEGE